MDNIDVISRLPRDLLISILSRLTLKQAMATSVLSRPWEKLWTFYHGNLDFEVSKKLEQNECCAYAISVNKAMDTLEQIESGGMLDSFTICFYLCPNNLRSVDRWVQFSLEKRTVKRLIIVSYLCIGRNLCKHRVLACDFPALRSSNSQRIRALTSIHFRGVNVSGEIIQQFLSSCPLLQRLDLINLYRPLIHLRVSGETLALRHLSIRRCPDLTDVELSAPNLVSLNVQYDKTTTKVNFDFRNVPKLVEFAIGTFCSYPHVTVLALRLLTCLSCIQKLELDIYNKELPDFTKLTALTSVKHLTLRLTAFNCQSILAWTPLLMAFPLLQKFTLNMCMRCDLEIDGMRDGMKHFPTDI